VKSSALLQGEAKVKLRLRLTNQYAQQLKRKYVKKLKSARINVIGNVYAIDGADTDATNIAATTTGRKPATKNAEQKRAATKKQSAAAHHKKKGLNGDETMEYTTIEPGTDSNQILFILFKKR
jgi:hypothetical protein